MYQLLDLYSFLLPTLKSSALQSVPTWLASTVTGVTADDAIDKHTDIAEVANGSRLDENRQTAGQTASPFSNADQNEDGLAKHSPVEHTSETDRHLDVSTQDVLPRGSSNDSAKTTIIHNEVESSGLSGLSPRNSRLPDALQSIAQALARDQPYVDMRDIVARGLVDQAAVFAAWAASDKCSQVRRWKSSRQCAAHPHFGKPEVGQSFYVASWHSTAKAVLFPVKNCYAYLIGM
jgi:hypothetical protein